MPMVRMLDGSTMDTMDPVFDPNNADPSQFDPSPEDPLGVLAPFLTHSPKWVIMAGLGDVDEIGPARKRWPRARYLGIEPDPRAITWQRERSWPPEQPIVCAALSGKIGTATIRMDSICCPSMHPENIAAAPPEQLQTVTTTTLDTLDREYGPFVRAILWLDCEGWDYTALLGAKNLLASGRVDMVNVEIWYRQPETNEKMRRLLADAGYVRVLTWFRQWWGCNEAYRRVP